MDHNANRIVVFPYHDVCFTLFAHALDEELLYPMPEDEEDATKDMDEDEDQIDQADKAGIESQKWSSMQKRRERVDKDSLYHAMTQIDNDKYALSVDYGGMEGVDQNWKCVPGEEVQILTPFLPLLYLKVLMAYEYHSTQFTTPDSAILSY